MAHIEIRPVFGAQPVERQFCATRQDTDVFATVKQQESMVDILALMASAAGIEDDAAFARASQPDCT
jgi:hypothetical protein